MAPSSAASMATRSGKPQVDMAVVAALVFVIGVLVCSALPTALAGPDDDVIFPGLPVPFAATPECTFWPVSVSDFRDINRQLYRCPSMDIILTLDIDFGLTPNQDPRFIAYQTLDGKPRLVTVRSCGGVKRVRRLGETRFAGLFYVYKATLRLVDVRIEGFGDDVGNGDYYCGPSRSGDGGGAVQLLEGGVLIAHRTTFINNTSVRGGAINILSSAKAFLYQCDFINNRAKSTRNNPCEECVNAPDGSRVCQTTRYGYGGLGGAISVGSVVPNNNNNSPSGEVVLRECVFTGNRLVNLTNDQLLGKGVDVYVFPGGRVRGCPDMSGVKYHSDDTDNNAVRSGRPAECVLVPILSSVQLIRGIQANAYVVYPSTSSYETRLSVMGNASIKASVHYAELEVGTSCTANAPAPASVIVKDDGKRFVRWPFGLNSAKSKVYRATEANDGSVNTNAIIGKVAAALNICPFYGSEAHCQMQAFSVCGVKNCPFMA